MTDTIASRLLARLEAEDGGDVSIEELYECAIGRPDHHRDLRFKQRVLGKHNSILNVGLKEVQIKPGVARNSYRLVCTTEI